MRVPLVAATAVLALSVSAPGASACCAGPPPRPPEADLYGTASAAFVGRLVAIHRGQGSSAVLRFRVERSYKRRLGRFLSTYAPRGYPDPAPPPPPPPPGGSVAGPVTGGDCGPSPLKVGDRVAAYLRRGPRAYRLDDTYGFTTPRALARVSRGPKRS